MRKSFSLTLLFCTGTLLVASFQNFAIADQAIKKANRFHKFEPVRSEDWPETAEPQDGDTAGSDSNRFPGSDSAMPQLRTLPDGSIDPDSFKDFTSFGAE